MIFVMDATIGQACESQVKNVHIKLQLASHREGGD